MPHTTRTKIPIFLFFFIIILFSMTTPVHALPTCPDDSVCLNNPLGTDSPHILIGRLIRTVLGISGSIALVVFIYAGLLWMTSSGNPEKIHKGKSTLFWAALGLTVVFSAYTLLRYIFTGLLTA